MYIEFLFFYSSPHLVHVRERIRINGDPLLKEDFVKYFDHIYNSLKKAVEVRTNGILFASILNICFPSVFFNLNVASTNTHT